MTDAADGDLDRSSSPSRDSHPFEAPLVDREPWMVSWMAVLGAWALTGAAAGTAIGLGLQLGSGVVGGGVGGGGTGILVGGALGAGALATERARSVARPELTDASGRRIRPLHGALFAVPAGVGVPALAALAAVGSAAVGSVVPGVAFGLGAALVGWGGVRAIARHRLTRALEALERGQIAEGVEALHTLAGTWFAGRGVASTARLNLAMLALHAGNADEALAWAAGVRGSAARSWASTTRALALLVRGDPPEDAEVALADAAQGSAGRAVQPESDAVRILVVWRRDGEDAARQLAEALYGPAATALHRALLARLRERCGASSGAAELRSAEVHALLAGGLGGAIAELR